MIDSYLTEDNPLREVGEESFLVDVKDGAPSSSCRFEHLYMPLVSEKDNIFREVLDKIPDEYKTRVNAFFSVLADVYGVSKNPNMQYIPIRLTDVDDNSIIFEWVFEDVRFMFIFNKDGNDSCSIVTFNQVEGRLSSTIIPLVESQYDKISKEIMSYLS